MAKNIIEELEKQLVLVRDAELFADSLAQEIETHMEAIKARYAKQLEAARQQKAEANKQITRLGLANKELVFGNGDRRDLKNGALLLTKKVSLAGKNAVTVEGVEAINPDAVKVVKTVDWDAVAKWNAVALASIGVTKKVKESVDYEVKL